MSESLTERRVDTKELRIQVVELAASLRHLEAGFAALEAKIERHIAVTDSLYPELRVHLAEWSAMKPQLQAVLDMVQKGKGIVWLVPVLVALAGMVVAAYVFLSTHALISRS